ncbi:hypothetical protein C8A01DRAFT_33715 [Parachaetomium inaequale]|uniref:Deoxyribonuclease NucA/NucB domain-containing protein n=1 Tax=Parachaetomium inaequale TaxID=2588326 RepID=A0AAN6PJM6_9PEZI|nr:hypothetical protein C8A01DRAFT_33715 [Parachaetomium inaequale]
MCAGIRNQKTQRPSQVPSDDIMVLTYAGPDRKANKKRRRESMCPGYCSGQKSPSGERLECDEFPLACTEEGGDGSSRMCIPSSQNSGLQGPMINCYLEFYNIQAGDKFVVRMDSCSSIGKSLRVRGNTPNNPDSPTVQTNSDGTLTLSSDATEWIPYPDRDTTGNGNGGGIVVIPLGNATLGSYTAMLGFSSLDGFQHLAVVDGEGFASWDLQGNNNGTLPGAQTPQQLALSFSLGDGDGDNDDDDTDLAVAAAASSRVSVSATLVATVSPPPPPATSSSAAARALAAPMAGRMGDQALAIVLGVLVAIRL